MAILATLSGSLNLFTNLPTTAPPNKPKTTNASSAPPKPPIPIPKYPPTLKSRRQPPPLPIPESNPALKTFHNRSKYYKPVKEGELISPDGDRAVVVGESGVSYRLPGAPFDFQFSYSETPKVKPLAIREPAFLPFAPPTMSRPWTGKAPLKQQRERRKIPLFGSVPSETDGVNQLHMPRPYQLGIYPTELKSRKEVLGKPLTREEIQDLLKSCLSSNRQVNLGRDGLTHNMLELVHSHWRRRPVCKVRCLGVPTIDMENVCRCLEERTGGKIIRRVGGVVYLFCGRNYDPRTRPRYPVMLWKPAAPVYPKLIQEAPEGLTKAEADELRMKGKNLLPICKLAKNGVYISLVKDVRNAFEGCPLVKIDCRGMHASDYKKVGAKLKELVPCVLLSFDEEHILIWRGKDWKSMYRNSPQASRASSCAIANDSRSSGHDNFEHHKLGNKTSSSSPKMMKLWNRAIEMGMALMLDEIPQGPDTLLQKVEEFESMSQAVQHSYQAVILGSEDGTGNSAEYQNQEDCQDDESDDDDDNIENHFDEPLKEVDYSVPLGSLPVDLVAKQLTDNDID